MTIITERIHISVPTHARTHLVKIAQRNKEPVARVASRLLLEALEIEEDAYFSDLADTRHKSSAEFVKNADSLWE